MMAVAPRISTTVPVDPATSGSQASSSCADQISPAVSPPAVSGDFLQHRHALTDQGVDASERRRPRLPSGAVLRVEVRRYPDRYRPAAPACTMNGAPEPRHRQPPREA